MIPKARRLWASERSWAIVSALALFTLAFFSLRANAQETIDPRSGRLSLTVTDLVVTDGPVKLELQRSLAGSGSVQRLFGTRWLLNWESRLSRLADLIVIEEGSASAMFTQQGGAAEYRSASGERLTLEQDGRAIRRKPDDSTETFDSQGRLIERADRNGNKVALRYGPDGRLARIEGPRGGAIQFTVDKSGRVTKVETWNGHTVDYAYSGESLAEVRVNGGPAQRYSYDGSGRLARIEDPATGSLEFAYDPQGRVLSRRSGDGASERYEYDDATNAVRHIDPAGAATTMRWSNGKRRAEFTDARGGKSVMDYDGAGRLVSVTGPTGATSRMTYDPAGRLIATENAAGHVTRFEYVGSSSRFQAMVRPDGSRQTFEYDSRGNLTASKIGAVTVAAYTYHPDGSIASVKGDREPESRFTYRSDGRIDSISNALGEATRFEYDTRGNRTSTINPLSGVTTRTYDSQDRFVSTTDPAGATMRYEYDAAGRVTAMTNAVGGITRYQYDSRGRLVAETNPAGQTTRSDYDSAGRVSRRSFPDGTAETFRYDVLGNLIAAVDRQGRSNQYEHDALGRLVRDRDAAGLEFEYRYDPAGNLLARQDSLGALSSPRHDAAGRVIEVKTPSGAVLKYAYDPAGRLIAQSDPAGHTTRYRYDAGGMLSELQEPEGNTARYGYDAAGRLTSLRGPSGGETRIAYDGLGNPLRLTNPAGQAVERAYDRSGRLISVARPNRQTVTYRYDALGRMVEKRLSSGKQVRYEYDARGNLLKADDGAFPVVYTRDAFGRVTQIEYPALRKSLRYEYNAAGSVSRMTDAEGSPITYAYDVAGRLTTIRLAAGQTIAFSYDSRGRLTSVQFPNGVTGRSEYDTENRLANISYSDAAGKILAGWRYGFDPSGNRIETAAADGRVTRYKYDAAGQIVEEAAAGAPAVRYSYLPGANRQRREAGADSIQYRYDAADALLQAGGTTFAHDANGNIIERRGPAGVTRYEYDAENRLVKVMRPDGGEVQFGYGPTGERVWRRDPSGVTYFVTDGLNVVAELDENFNAKASYLHAQATDAPLMMRRDGQNYFYLRDRLGSVAGLTGERGEPVASYDYDAFGVLRGSQSAVANPFTFASREIEPALGLYYFRARYYDPELGRFLSVDPLLPPLDNVLDQNPYVYAANNPLRYADPLGLAIDWTPAEWLYNHVDDLAAIEGDEFLKKFWPADRLRDIANLQDKIARIRANNPAGIEPVRPASWGPRVSEMYPDPPPPGVNRGGPTQTIPRSELPQGARPGSNTQAVPRPGAEAPAGGSGVPWGSVARVAGGVVTGGVGLANVYACINESRKTAKDCLEEAGMIIGGTAVGVLIAPAIAAGLIALGVSPAVLVAGGVAAAAVGVYQAGNRLVNAANEPAAIAEAQRQAELATRFATLFPGMSAKIEAKVAAFEKKAVSSSAKDVREARTRAEAFADAAASNLAALRGDLGQAGAFCAVANRLGQEMNALAADADNRLSLLDTGLTAADGIVAACKDKDRVTQAKELYQQGIRMAAEMVILGQRSEKAQGLLQEARASADRALAGAEQRAQMIAGNAEVADAAAAQARAAGGDGNAARLAGLAGERGALDGEIDAFPNWFPDRPEVKEAVGGWKGRVAAAFARAQESGADQADVNAAGLAATRAASRRDEAASMITEAKARVDGCEQSATAAIGNAVAATTAANAAAAGTLGRFAGLPASADACISKLNAPTKSLVALHVQCPARAFVGDLVTCTATGVYDDNFSKAEDMTPGPWDVGPVFTTQQPGPVTVSITRANMSDAATVNFENRPPPTTPTYNPFGDPNFMPGAPKPPVSLGQTPGATTIPDGPASSGTGFGQGGAPIPQNYGQPTGESKPTGSSSSTATSQQPLSCWSDLTQSYVQVLGYVCPSTNTQPVGKPPLWTDLPLSPSSPSSTGSSSTGGKPGMGSKPAKGGSSGGGPPPSGGSCGPMTTCKCAGGAIGHIPCDKSMGACHCGPG